MASFKGTFKRKTILIISTSLIGLALAFQNCGGGGGSGTSGDTTPDTNNIVEEVDGDLFFLAFNKDIVKRQLFQYDLDLDLISLIDGDYEIPDNLGVVPELFLFSGKIYFVGKNSINGRELWVYDPNEEVVNDQNPKMLVDFNSGNSDGIVIFSDFVEFDNKIFYNASNSSGSFLVVYDPSLSVSATNPSRFSSVIGTATGLVGLNGKLYFSSSAKDFVYDPAEPISNVSGSENPSENAGIHPDGKILKTLKGFTYFSGYDPANSSDIELWSLDLSQGNSAVPKQLSDVTSVSHIGRFSKASTDGNKLYYSASNNNNENLWEYDPTVNSDFPDNPKQITTGLTNNTNIFQVEAVGNKVYINADDSINGAELWVMSPALSESSTNPFLIVDLDTQDANNDLSDDHGVNREMIALGPKIYFQGTDSHSGNLQLWEYDTREDVNIGTNPREIDNPTTAILGQFDPQSFIFIETP